MWVGWHKYKEGDPDWRIWARYYVGQKAVNLEHLFLHCRDGKLVGYVLDPPIQLSQEKFDGKLEVLKADEDISERPPYVVGVAFCDITGRLYFSRKMKLSKQLIIRRKVRKNQFEQYLYERDA